MSGPTRIPSTVFAGLTACIEPSQRNSNPSPRCNVSGGQLLQNLPFGLIWRAHRVFMAGFCCTKIIGTEESDTCDKAQSEQNILQIPGALSGSVSMLARERARSRLFPRRRHSWLNPCRRWALPCGPLREFCQHNDRRVAYRRYVHGDRYGV